MASSSATLAASYVVYMRPSAVGPSTSDRPEPSAVACRASAAEPACTAGSDQPASPRAASPASTTAVPTTVAWLPSATRRVASPPAPHTYGVTSRLASAPSTSARSPAVIRSRDQAYPRATAAPTWAVSSGCPGFQSAQRAAPTVCAASASRYRSSCVAA